MILRAGTSLYNFAIKIAALANSSKAKKRVIGVKESWKVLERQSSSLVSERVWFHCASLGEFEQARPLIERIRKSFPQKAIIVTFYSPSGYEIRKDYSLADLVLYLPEDSPKNARRFLELLKPNFAFFIKYEFWPNFLHKISQQGIPLFSISAIFRENQVYFGLLRRTFLPLLQNFDHLFLQNEASARLLKQHGLDNVSVAGDTRFDRVNELAQEPVEIPIVKEFAQNTHTLVAGSVWPEDTSVLAAALHQYRSQIKLVIAPHDITSQSIRDIRTKFSDWRQTLFSTGHIDQNCQLLIIDNVGLLSKLYKYATVTFVGGAFNTGLHNILEPAVYGKPVFFGPEYHKFNEAQLLIKAKGGFSVEKPKDLAEALDKLLMNKSYLKTTSENSRMFIQRNIGATDHIIKKLTPQLHDEN